MRTEIPVVVVALAGLAACSEPEHVSPFDPGSPPALQARASLQGKVTLESVGATPPALAGTQVSVPGIATVTTDAAGSYTLQGVPSGRYTVTASRAGYDDGEVAGVVVTLDDGEQTIAVPDLRLSASRGDVVGAVALTAGAAAGFPVGADLTGVIVTLVSPEGASRSAVSGPSGEYRFEGVPVSPAGAAHTLRASKPFFLSGTAAVDVLARTLMPAPALSLEVDVGSVAGAATLWDDVGGVGANATSAGVVVSLVGTAFNGVSWPAGGVTAADGSFTIGSLPPGSYDVLATSDGRDCGPSARVNVTPGGAESIPPVRCVDAVAPGAVSLGPPLAPAGGLSGYAPGASVAVSIAAQATDATAPASNLRGYQLVVGSAMDWSRATLVEGQPASLTFSGLAPDALNLLWVRAVDWVGNAGPVAAAQVITDAIPPPAPTISTPRLHVDATTTSITLSGSDADANFGGYEICTAAQAATTSCPATPPGCAWTATSPSFALSLASGQRTCLYARAWDRAGTRSEVSSLGAGGVVSDLTPPTPPVLVPAYDPSLLTVRAPWVDFFVSAASTDAPAGVLPWQDVAWIEVDTGSGFTPLCPAAECHPDGTYAPCGCGCTDARLVCDAGQLVAVRAPLAQGTTRTIAFRAVDLAGNVGSGVSQQVTVDSTGDVVAGTAAIDSGPILRGGVLAYASWTPGAGNPHGVIVELGANRRLDATDARCDVAGWVASGYDRGIAPVSETLVAIADGTGRFVRAGAGGLCGGAAVVSPTTFRTPTGSYSVRGVSGAGEVVAWWEDDYPAGIAHVYVREGGADGAFGTGDDVVTLLATFSQVNSVTLGERALLVRECATGGTCQPNVWRVYNANASGGFASGTSFVDLPSTVESPSVSPDGRQVAWVDTANVVHVRTPGANGVFDAADDVTVSRAIPAEWGLGVSGYHHTLGVDGPHVMAMAYGAPLNHLVHWWAGLDGAFGTADDTLARTHATNGTWGSLSLAASLVACEDGSDVKLVDLSTLRWEVAPGNGFQAGTAALVADGRGNLLYEEYEAPLVARTAAGAETTGPAYRAFAAEGSDLAGVDSASAVWVHRPDSGGAWFTAAAPPRANVYTSTDWINDVAVGGGKAILVEYVGSNAYRFKILEPRSGTLATLPTTGAVVDALGADQGWAWAYGVNGRQAFYTCNGISTSVCVRNAGADGWFGTVDDTTTWLVHPPGSPRAPNLVRDARAFVVSGTRMLLAEFSPPALYLLDAGADGLFNTPDDRGRKVADGYFARTSIALAGRTAAFAAEGAPAGAQIHLVGDLAQTPTPVTAHYSAKSSLAVEPGGRVFWVDSVFAPEAVFVRAP